MSETAMATLGEAPSLRRPFRPSIAQDARIVPAPRHGRNASITPEPLLLAARWAFAVSTSIMVDFNPSSAFGVLADIARAIPRVQRPAIAEGRDQAVAITTQDLVSALKHKGMPVAALAEILNVERKTVYSWLDNGIEAQAGNHNRLRQLHDLLSEEADGSLRFYHRFWERKLPRGDNLKTLLTEPDIEPRQIKNALNALRPAVLRAMQADAERKAVPRPTSPAASLTLLLRAGG
jgi:hypothetical protein